MRGALPLFLLLECAMQKLYYLIGIPASGKTTWAEKFCEMTGAVHCSIDNVRREKFGGYDPGKTQLAYRYLDNVVLRKLFDGQDVVYDTMGVSAFWDEKLELFRPYAEIIAVYFNISLEEAVRRNAKRGGTPESYLRMATRWVDKPTVFDGFSKVIYVEDCNEVLPCV